MKILVTGATGYVGGRLVQFLSERGHRIIGTTRQHPQSLNGWPPTARLVTLNAIDLSAPDLDLIGQVDAVIHLAAANEIRSAQDPEAAMLETCGATRRLLEACIACQVKRFIFLSTTHVYASPLEGHFDERSLTRPAHPYAISHKAGEDYVYAANKAGRISGITVRLSNSIGAPAWRNVDRWTLVGNDLARQAIETGEILIKAPNQWRDFIPMTDVCLGIDLLLAAAPAALGDGIFNLAGDLPLRIIDIGSYMVAAAEAVMGSSIALKTAVAVETAGAPVYTLGIDRLVSLGFKPSGIPGLEAELRATLQLLSA